MCQLCDWLPEGPAPFRCLILAAVIVAAIALIAELGRAAHRVLRDRFTIDQTVAVRSGVDGMSYRVHGDHEDPQAAADLLAALNRRTTDLMRWLRRRYVGAPGAAPTAPAALRTRARVTAVENMLARYNPDNLAENSPLDTSGDSSYCLDKGAVIALCLRSRALPAQAGRPAVPAGRLHGIDTLTFVTLHEIAHTAIEDIDHPPRFWSTFKFILAEAATGGIFHSPDFARAPVDYCGVYVDYNPAYDPQLSMT